MLRDLGRLDITATVVDRTVVMLKGIADPELGTIASRSLAGFEELANETRRSVEDAGHGEMHFRATLEHLVRGHQVALLLDAAQQPGPLATELAAAAAMMTGRYLDRSYQPEHDPAFDQSIKALLGADLD